MSGNPGGSTTTTGITTTTTSGGGAGSFTTTSEGGLSTTTTTTSIMFIHSLASGSGPWTTTIDYFVIGQFNASNSTGSCNDQCYCGLVFNDNNNYNYNPEHKRQLHKKARELCQVSSVIIAVFGGQPAFCTDGADVLIFATVNRDTDATTFRRSGTKRYLSFRLECSH